MVPFSFLSRETATAAVRPVLVSYKLPVLHLFLAFQIVNQTILPILVATFLFSSAKRHPTLINVCMTWIYTGIFGSLLLYAGKHVGPEPPKVLCITQAALLDGVLPMTSVAVLTLVVQTHISIRKPKEESGKFLVYILLLVPYLVFFLFTIAASMLATQQPQKVNRARRFFYCSYENRVFSDFFAAFTSLMLLVTAVYQVAIGVFVYKNWNALRNHVQTSIRVLVFGSYVILTLILSLLSISPHPSPVPDLLTASVGTILALSLGTQHDVFQVWFRRRRPVHIHLEPVPDNWSAFKLALV